MKDKTPSLYNSNVVELPCSQCEGCYIGQTTQWMKQRITQNRSDCRFGKNTYAVVEHHQRTGHNFDYENVKILARGPHDKNIIL